LIGRIDLKIKIMDRRKDYSKFKITIIELWFRFEYFGRQTFINRLGVRSRRIYRILDEWEQNDECILVESKLNNTAKTYL
jgi:hypothetical protein